MVLVTRIPPFRSQQRQKRKHWGPGTPCSDLPVHTSCSRVVLRDSLPSRLLQVTQAWANITELSYNKRQSKYVEGFVKLNNSSFVILDNSKCHYIYDNAMSLENTQFCINMNQAKNLLISIWFPKEVQSITNILLKCTMGNGVFAIYCSVGAERGTQPR